MCIQDAVLDALEKNRGEYLSGEQLASSLGVSRNAVWKAIQKLEEAGHKIRAVPKRGYTLAPESDVKSCAPKKCCAASFSFFSSMWW